MSEEKGLEFTKEYRSAKLIDKNLNSAFTQKLIENVKPRSYDSFATRYNSQDDVDICR